MITFQTEPWGEFFKDAEAIFPEHYEELALDKDKIALAPNVEIYEEAEAKRILHIVTARDGGELVGYFIAGILPHLHYREAGLMGSTDAYYLKPEYRNGTGAKLILEVERTMREKRVTKIYLSHKAHMDHSDLFRALGYRLSDLVYTKLL